MQTGRYFSIGQLLDMGKGGPWGRQLFEGADFPGTEEQPFFSEGGPCATAP